VFEEQIKKPLSKKILFEDLKNITITIDFNEDKDEFILG